MKLFQAFLLIATLACLAAGNVLSRPAYPWLRTPDLTQVLENRVPPPDGFVREPALPGSFASWLRGLPLLPGKPAVLLHNGNPKWNQGAHVAVVNMDVGKKDLQQCADAAMRLWAEYLYSQERDAEICFDFTSGDAACYSQWESGLRPHVDGNQVQWKQTGQAQDSYSAFRQYLESVFIYAGSASLETELIKVPYIQSIRAGDVFIQGGFPGHAVMVADVATHARTGNKVFLLVQSYMPAQQVHVLKNPNNPALSPWYAPPLGSVLETPEWTFNTSNLMRFSSND